MGKSRTRLPEKDGIGYNDLETFDKHRERGNRHVFGPYFY
jgi:hypothetical protein